MISEGIEIFLLKGFVFRIDSSMIWYVAPDQTPKLLFGMHGSHCPKPKSQALEKDVEGRVAFVHFQGRSCRQLLQEARRTSTLFTLKRL
jgi:hypothetical protein